jgi:hypothetical protein
MRNQTSRNPSLLLSGLVVLVCLLSLEWTGLRQDARADSPSNSLTIQKVKQKQDVEKNPAQDVLDTLVNPNPWVPGPEQYHPARIHPTSPREEGRHKAIIWNHGSEQRPGKEEDLGRFYAGNGYVAFLPHRRSHGKSGRPGRIHRRQTEELR